ncbi:copper chaperone PCu(A)C [Bosea vestrisii]|uniref:copper chaperone PCu(A)C n=1 Tax=Bosea vestrisii TaxID=151416 RepID=UPI0024DF471C|nr:copper chaperone PCu(A)C [Bosea vestrisii]WID94849.1 copper chaperone PCu(A)C [Bosea vestrisii]
MIKLRLPLAAAALALGCGTALAQDYTAGPLKIEQPWTRATPAGAKVAGGYVAVTNTGSSPDRLLGGSSEIAGKVEIHEMAVNNGVMTMRGLPDGVELKPGAKTELKPGGYHIMFMDLKRQLKEGETVKGTLTFEKAGAVPVEFSVQSVGARAPAEAHKH